jgi:hypothetical protein
VETEKYKGLTIEIHQDADPESPREWGNSSNMVCFHKRYNLGDKQKGILETAQKNVGGGDPAEYLREHLCDYAEENEWDLKNMPERNGWDLIEFYLRVAKGAEVILPLYLYDHSGITMNTTGFSCPWDSGRVGVIYITRDAILSDYAVKDISDELRCKVAEDLKAEVAAYDQYLTGDVYGYVIKDGEGEDLDVDLNRVSTSCWGFYGLECCREEARSAADDIANELDDKACTVTLHI